MAPINEKLLDAASRRLADARRIADSLRHNKKLHQLAMKAVFALEDCVFELSHTPGRKEKPSQNQRW